MLGESLALAAALTWSLAVILFKRSDTVGAASMNLFKNVTALTLLGLTMLATGRGVDMSRSPEDWGALAASGVLGIAVADTLEFSALRRLGAGLLAVVNLLYSPVIVTLSVLVLDESLGMSFALGAPLVLAGVFLAITGGGLLTDTKKGTALGAFMGASAMVTMGIGVVLAKPVLQDGDLVEVTAVRLAAGIAAQSVVLLAVPRWRSAFRVFLPGPVYKTLLPASVLGSYLAMLLWLGGFKWADASIASVLNQMSTIFTIVLARLLLGEHFSRRQAWGAALALGGALTILAS